MSSHNWAELSIRFVTPMLLDGHHRQSDSRLYPRTQLVPALRSELRWWWRAMVGPLAGTDHALLRSLEAHMFGLPTSENDGHHSPLRFRLLSNPACEPFESSQLPALVGHDDDHAIRVAYLLGGQRASGDDRWSYIPANDQGQFTVGVWLAPRAPELTELFSLLLWVVNRWGGLGYRSRRGFGAIEATWDSPTMPNAGDNVDDVLHRAGKLLGSRRLISAISALPDGFPSPFPQFRPGHYMAGQLTLPVQTQPHELLATAGQRWANHRAVELPASHNDPPSRTKPAKQAPLHQPNRPETGGNQPASNELRPLRFASPVRFRPTTSPQGAALHAIGFVTSPYPTGFHTAPPKPQHTVPLALPNNIMKTRVKAAVRALTQPGACP